MENKGRRYSAGLVGLLFLLAGSVVACGQPAADAPSPAAPAEAPTVGENQPAEPPPGNGVTDEDGWRTVETFTGEGNQTTSSFHVPWAEWRITWTMDAEYPEYAVLDLFVHRGGAGGLYVRRVSHSGGTASASVDMHQGGEDYCIEIIAANLRSWTIAVQRRVAEIPESPFVITRVNYDGRDYLVTGTVWYRTVGTDETSDLYPTVEDDEYVSIHYPILEADEYVEIKNRTDSWQDMGGWRLKNATCGPTFTFPSLVRGSTEYCDLPACVPLGAIHPEVCGPPAYCLIAPHHSIRVYTGEVHPESGGFRFSCGTGDIWDNEEPDTAVLYNAMGREMSRRSYTVPAGNKVVVEE